MSSPPSFEDLRILIVEDESFMRTMIRRFLESFGLKNIFEATDGADGLSTLKTADPDLIILDIMMTPMNGLQFLKTLRIGLSGAPFDLPVIVLTGSTEAPIVGAAMALDCDAFIKKDAGPQAIRERIERTLKEKATTKTASAYHQVSIPEISIDKPFPAPTVSNSEPSGESAKELPIIEVEEGSIVDRDVLSEDGYVLLSEGTELTTANLNQLSDLSEIIDLQTVWVRT